MKSNGKSRIKIDFRYGLSAARVTHNHNHKRTFIETQRDLVSDCVGK
jgi:hypothetical protein